MRHEATVERLLHPSRLDERAEARRHARGVPDASPEVAGAQHFASRRREYEIVTLPTDETLDESIAQEPRHDNRARLVRLRRAEHGSTIDLGHGLGDVQAATHRVHTLHAERRRLAEAEAAVAEHEHE